jgi:hypothetical protein
VLTSVRTEEFLYKDNPPVPLRIELSIEGAGARTFECASDGETLRCTTEPPSPVNMDECGVTVITAHTSLSSRIVKEVRVGWKEGVLAAIDLTLDSGIHLVVANWGDGLLILDEPAQPYFAEEHLVWRRVG